MPVWASFSIWAIRAGKPEGRLSGIQPVRCGEGEFMHCPDGGHGGAGISAGFLDGLDGAEFPLPEEQVDGVEFRGCDDGYRESHEAGMGGDPLECLHAAHRDAHDGMEAGELEVAGEETVLRFDHVTDSDAREFAAAERWGAADTVASASTVMMKYWPGPAIFRDRCRLSRFSERPENQVGREQRWSGRR